MATVILESEGSNFKMKTLVNINNVQDGIKNLISILQVINKLIPNKYDDEIIKDLQMLSGDTLLLTILTELVNGAGI